MANKKGILGPISPAIILLSSLFVVTIIVFAVALALSNMRSSLPSDTATLNYSSAASLAGNASTGVGQFASLSPTMWLMVAIGLLLTIVFAAIGFAIYRQSGE